MYQQAAAAGKRVQCLGEAKNHALVMNDAVLERTASGIIKLSADVPVNAAWRCR